MAKSFIVFVLLFLLVTFSNPVFAQTPPPGCDIPGPNNTYYCEASGIIQIQQLLTRLINISVTIAFMALTVWLVWSAIKFFITSGGDPKALSHAWMSITWAFLGIFFLVLAWLVMRLIAEVTGADVTQYCLGFKPYCML